MEETDNGIEEEYRRLSMVEILNYILGFGVVIFMGFFAYETSKMVSEKKERQRKGLTDYYDRPFNKHNTHYRDGDNT